MSLRLGKIGLPNTGKTLIFNAITKSNAKSTDYLNIKKPNFCIINILDPRLSALGIQKTDLDHLINKIYNLLGLITVYTATPQEITAGISVLQLLGWDVYCLKFGYCILFDIVFKREKIYVTIIETTEGGLIKAFEKEVSRFYEGKPNGYQ
jgi:hypothetical protein